MTTNEAINPIGASLKRINALLAWWGVPKICGIWGADYGIRRLQNFATDLQTLYGDAAARQIKALLVTNEGIADSLCHLLQQRHPEDLLALESQLTTSVPETMAFQAKTWIEVSQQMTARCTAFARETAQQPQFPPDWQVRRHNARSAGVDDPPAFVPDQTSPGYPALPIRSDGITAQLGALATGNP